MCQVLKSLKYFQSNRIQQIINAKKNLEGLHPFMSNKSYVYLLNVEPNNLVFLKIYNTNFDEITITFNDQNGRPFIKENKINLKLLINKYK